MRAIARKKMQVVDIFMSGNMVQPAPSYGTLSRMQGHPQAHLLELNLVHTPHPKVADTILGNKMFTHYDRPRIANLC